MAYLTKAEVAEKHKDLKAFLQSQLHAWDSLKGAGQRSRTDWALAFNRDKWRSQWETVQHRLTNEDFDEWLAGVQRHLEQHWPSIRWTVN